jgi:hypothetical protein
MKYRKGFVTNSSSSSYVCDVCGEEASGWDLSLHDAEMLECENGHIFCESHMIGTIPDYDESDEEFDRYSAPTTMCPICMFQHLMPKDGLAYLLKQMGVTKEELLHKISEEYQSYGQFMADIRTLR